MNKSGITSLSGGMRRTGQTEGRGPVRTALVLKRLSTALYLLVLSIVLWTSGPHSAAADEGLSGDAIIASIVGVRSNIPASARTAETLGTVRQGTGVVIDDSGLVLTIGYLIMEADDVTVSDANGQTLGAEVVGYDHNTGFGLVRTLEPLTATPARIGTSADLKPGDAVISVSKSGTRPVTPAQVVSRRAFAGYWEYLLDGAIFTQPANPGFGGAPLFDKEGQLVGIGSLIVEDATGAGTPSIGNMFVPIDALKPIMNTLIETGRGSGPVRPWLGVYMTDNRGRVQVVKVAEDGPAEQAGVEAGDLILGVSGKHVSNMADFLRRVWAEGPAGTEVTIDVLPARSGAEGDLTIRKIPVRSRDRYDWLRLTLP